VCEHEFERLRNMIIRGDVVLKCPKTGKEVRLYKDCMKAGDPHNTCPHFKHWGIEGTRIVIACNYEDWRQTYKQD
jgi:hypothetical protein